MKYNININQKVLHTSKLDLVDSSILDWLMIMCNSKNENIESKRLDGMTWIDYGTLLQDMPMLRIKSTSSLTPRFKKLQEEGYIKTKTIREGSVTKIYVSLEPKIDSLFVSTSPSTRLNEQTSTRLNEAIIILDTNHYTSDTPRGGHTHELALKCFDQFWLAYPNKSSKKKSQEIWSRKNLDKHIEKILGFITEAKKTKRWREGFIKDPTTFLRNESWLDDLASYGNYSVSPNPNVYKDKKETDYSGKTINLKNI